MKYTLLELVQSVLNEMVGDDVTSISDTEESSVIALMARDVFFELIHSRDWEHLRKLTKPAASGVSPRNTHIIIADDISRIRWIKYDKQLTDDAGRKKYSDVQYLAPDDFLMNIQGRNNLESTIDVVADVDGTELMIRNDKHPTYWTSFDDTNIVFDSFDTDIDTEIDKDKLQIYADTIPTWTATDGAIPDLPDDVFSHLLEELKSRAMLAFKGQSNQKTEQSAQRTRRRISRSAYKSSNGLRHKNYGRR